MANFERKQMLMRADDGGFAGLGNALDDARDVLGPVAKALEPLEPLEDVPAQVQAQIEKQGRENAAGLFVAGVAVGFAAKGLLKTTAGFALAGAAVLFVASRFAEDDPAARKKQHRPTTPPGMQGFQRLR